MRRPVKEVGDPAEISAQPLGVSRGLEIKMWAGARAEAHAAREALPGGAAPGSSGPAVDVATAGPGFQGHMMIRGGTRRRMVPSLERMVPSLEQMVPSLEQMGPSGAL